MYISDLLKDKKEITLGFFGGSITEGSGASDNNETSYRALVTKWFRDTYKDNTFIHVNAGVGGTGSDLGACRIYNDLLIKNPDIVFVEFAVNDHKTPPEIAKPSIEGIIKHILKVNPKALIIFIYTTSLDQINEFYSKGLTPNAIIYQEEILKHYNIPSINVGKALYDTLLLSKETLNHYLPDNVHPNDLGYLIYANEIIRMLPQINIQITDKAPLTQCFDNGAMLLAKNYISSNWELSNESMFNRCQSYICSERPGAELTFEFTGRLIGLYLTIQKDSGNLLYSIDGGPLEEVSTWDKYALQFDRANYRILSYNLEDTKHTLKIIVSENKEEKSLGNMIRIGAFLTA